ncbi:Zinc finger BED domain-containing protein RICESLEEPER 2 [Linum perenne]
MGKPKYHEKLGQILSAVNHIPAARHRRCCRHRGNRTADCGVLRHYHRWIGSLHRPHHHSLHRFVPVVLLSPEASYELPAIGGFHRRDFLCCGIDVCIHKRCARLTMDSQNSQSIPFLPPLHDGRETRTKCRTKGGLRSRLTGATSRSTPIPPTRKPMKKRSVYWKYYALDTDEMGKNNLKCLICKKLFVSKSTNGTSGLKRHHEICSKKNSEVMLELNLLSGTINDPKTDWKFDQADGRKALAEMIILDEQPFTYVHYQGFRRFMKRVCPILTIPGRKTVREDCYRLFKDSKITLKDFFRTECKGRISLTTDAWTSLSNMNFMCVTAHFINKEWKLCKKIIGFVQITSHTGVDIGETLATCLEEWGIKNILCIATDNASANDTAIVHMRHKLKLWGSDFLDSKYLHIRCVAHVVNLVVNDGLRECSISIERLREAVKWVKSSPARLAKFKKKYEAAFKLLEGNDKNFKSYLLRQKYQNETLRTPTPFDWNNVRRLMKYLKFFYDLTVRVSGTSYVTTHLFCKELCDMFDEIAEMEESYDLEVREMAFRIKLKVAKYWLEEDGVPNAKLNRLLYIAVILDPRRKFEYVEFILSRMYGLESGGKLANEVKDGILEMFRYYKQLLAANAQSRISSPNVREDGTIPISRRKGGTDAEFVKKRLEAIDRGNRKIMKKKAVKLKLVKRMMVQVRWKDLFDRARLMWVY